ncbi:MAG: CocE/NonD family hydrolase [Candidatus Abyssobacteria bacterium SURF_17]|jgi:putative CocE/NonD family hydrolase|uniref:CocE/NonD family hydrolase n=1 Tax=Candidatus Abyssobacteria bacterium SURF_17 TaxID=2093361 RepID=A0A419ESR8_9BACT|nr:MAG: CocE/NonD family hydrolase [Candidatus Abyssubacteria bacterium SURF_17]
MWKRSAAVLLRKPILAILVLLLAVQPAAGHLGRTQENTKSFFKADLQWVFYSFVDQLHKHFRLPFMKVENGTPDRYARVSVEKNVAIPMRDGVRLYANIYRPKADEKFPAILIRLPYGKDEYYCWMPAVGKFYARKGYACVVQDVRGKFCSEGAFEPLVNEVEDGYDTLDWITKQPWCDGNIGMEGESYYGYTAWAGAASNHPNLKCIAPMNTAMDFYEAIYQDGAFVLQTAGTYPILMNSRTYQNVLRLDPYHLPLIAMDDAAGIPSAYYDQIVSNPMRGDDWERANLYKRCERINIPVLVFANWYDVFLKTTINDWARAKESAAHTALEGKQWMVIGPMDHESTPEHTHKVGKIDIGDKSSRTRWEVKQAFFDYWLKGIENGFDKTPPVRLFVIGDNEWRYENEWPLARTEYTSYYFHSNGSANTVNGDGQLSPQEPNEEPCDTFVYDPADPVPTTLGLDLWFLAAQLQDRPPVGERSDVLVYTSAPLEKGIELTGPISVTLYAASSAVDTDFTATLLDVFPDGYLHLIQEGIVRASYRESDTEPTPIEPDKVYEYDIDLWATSHVVRAGHRLRVEISSSNFDRFARNLNTGKNSGTTSDMLPATQKIYHTPEYPSHITLPIIP